MSVEACLGGCKTTCYAVLDGLAAGIRAALDNPNLTPAEREALWTQYLADQKTAVDNCAECIAQCWANHYEPGEPES